MERAEYELMDRLETSMWWYRDLHAQILGLVQPLLRPGGRVIDAGCGTGGILRRIGAARSDVERVGLDFDLVACGMAREKSGASVVRGSIDRLPFVSGSTDLVVSCDVLCHRNVDQAAALAEFRRVLRPGGHGVFNLPAYMWMMSAHDRLVHTARRYTASDFRRALVEAGLRPVLVGYRNTLLFPLMALHRLATRGRPGEASDVKEYPPALDRLFGAVLWVERALAGLGLRLPFGGSVIAVAVKDA
jgi:ubiquinone/menaquinone biosynthesis C-methylase UbiE